MAKAPNMCPMCNGDANKWIKVDTTRKGFSVTKAVIGGLILLNPVGLVAGALGKKKEIFSCANCGFRHEYDA